METFAKKLASSEERCTSLSDKDYLRLWKALFYSMWMADKPSYQQNLAKRLGDIWLDIHKVSSEAGLLYVRTFWETMTREWPGIDRHRLDKYYFMVRRFLLAGFECMKHEDWDLECIRAYNKVLSELPLNPTRGDVPDALRIYFLENFSKVFMHMEASDLSAEVSQELLRPYVELAAHSVTKPVLSMAETLFKSLLEDNVCDSLNVQSVGKLALSLGEVEDCTTLNRKVLYAASQLLLKA
ncbi:hypothetical protein PSACC_03269 [Paramicrosporidium saccamoebae]|uniref:Uncharacterized protein n=1 Tax=Paramicrosporidium saccamoebae TaxID=1246581 RepID=A0A2H9TGN2_9FUNG|nr:hypothetical protein PSACC_03269 [Paramicrosporidium saccamoebae]